MEWKKTKTGIINNNIQTRTIIQLLVDYRITTVCYVYDSLSLYVYLLYLLCLLICVTIFFEKSSGQTALDVFLQYANASGITIIPIPVQGYQGNKVIFPLFYDLSHTITKSFNLSFPFILSFLSLPLPSLITFFILF